MKNLFFCKDGSPRWFTVALFLSSAFAFALFAPEPRQDLRDSDGEILMTKELHVNSETGQLEEICVFND